MKSLRKNKDYSKFLNDIKSEIESRYTKVVYEVNRELIALYQSIGKMIVQR